MDNITSETFPSGQGTLEPENQKGHFYISHVGEDTNMAAWIASTLEDEGYLTILKIWDLRPGSDLVEWKNSALSKADRVMVLLSPSYLKAINRTEVKES